MRFVREIYAGPKADLHDIHEALMNEIASFRPIRDCPKKGYISLPAQETVRHDRPGNENSRRGRVEHEGVQARRA